jgi:hypothetical protein
MTACLTHPQDIDSIITIDEHVQDHQLNVKYSSFGTYFVLFTSNFRTFIILADER